MSAVPLTPGCLPDGDPHEDSTETVYLGPSMGPVRGSVPTTQLWMHG